MCVCESRVCVCRGRVAELKRHCLISQRRSAGSDIKAKSPSDVRLMYWEGEEKVKMCTQANSHHIKSLASNQRREVLEEEQLSDRALTTSLCAQASRFSFYGFINGCFHTRMII